MGKSGFVTLAGRPNVGKSTLINRLVGSKIAITSPRPQTTRNRIVGILTRPDVQIVFIDTPGLAAPKTRLGKSMVSVSVKAGAEADLLVFVTDASRYDVDEDRKALARLGRGPGRRYLVVNKTDLVAKGPLLERIAAFGALGDFEEIVPVSAKTGENLDKLVELIAQALPEGPSYYPDDMISDQPERFVVGEIIREKAIFRLQKELPYSAAVAVESVEDRSQGLTYISAVIFVERESQKGIVIGKGGANLKQIGASARRELEKRLSCRVYLDLHVKVKEKWTRDSRIIHDFGYGSPE